MMYDLYADIPEEESQLVWAVVNNQAPPETAWYGSRDGDIIAVVN